MNVVCYDSYKLRASSIITTVSIWHYCMNRDFEDFVKLDTVDSNLARKYI